ncbi:Anaphase-promoting complex subunit 1 [Morella rubra]|uniref:Anaphase-promoting complex subunit 1 n=1 Tax=Morella rubra TaxID=262757 RepID=A0A6A1W1F0_9ROSI|nr:Anaphase-promoting complex subunit 1 [Morella rubra]
MSLGVRHLTLLGEFKPFGLIAENLDGKPVDNGTDDYDYFLFDPQVVRERDEAGASEASASAFSDRSDHELFIRGNRIIWTTGARVFKRFTLPSPVIKACWCRLGNMAEALLCFLQVDSLTIYNTSGEVVSIPLPCTITSIWSLPFGLLLQQTAYSPTNIPFPSSSPPLFGARDIPRHRREISHSPQHSFGFQGAFDSIFRGDIGSMCSHLILKDPLEEPQLTYIEERGKLNIMKEFDERTIWTSDQIPLMASYNKGKMQHSVWVAEAVSNHEVANANLASAVPADVFPKQFSFHRIWQGKGAQTAACKVFLATDTDAAPIICFLHQEQKKMLAVRLQSVEINNEILFDINLELDTRCCCSFCDCSTPFVLCKTCGNSNISNPSASDQDLQQAQLWNLAQRTTALPIGRGAFTLATIYTLLTEVNLDPNLRNIPEIKSWPEFHNAVAAGLRLAPLQSLYFHIPAQHPSSYPELEFPTLLQSAALMSVGLLYEGSAHPPTMQILLGEIGRRSGGDNVLEREGYAVSAGFSLGLVALGRGEDALVCMDTMVDRLFHYIGGKEVRNEQSLFSTLSTGDQSRGAAQMMDGTVVNIDVTAPGATIALSLMFLKTESEAIVSKLSIPQTSFELQYVRPDFIMLRVVARNLIMWSRIHPSKDWIQLQIPEIVKNGVKGLGVDASDIDDMEAEALVQAYVNIVAGACISIGLRFAGTKNGDAQELLYEYAIYFLNEIKPVSATKGNTFPKGLSQYIDRATLEICLHLIVLSLSVIMAGSGHLQTFRLLRFLRSRNSADGHANYGSQMAVSLAIGFLFLGGGMRTFSTSNSSVAALLITLYPRLPTGPNDNRCHLQAFRHLYVLAMEARWIQTVDVDTGLPVYAPLEVTTRETEHYAETSFCEVTPCLLPERAILKTIRVCGPRYWPQVIELQPEDALTDKPWWTLRDKDNPFKSGVLYIKRKVGACSYVDDPVGSQSLLSRAMHKVFGLTSSTACEPTTGHESGPGSLTVDQLEFCLQVLFECVSKDRPALLQVYLSLYTTVASMADQVSSGPVVFGDSLFISSLKLAMNYTEALLGGRLTTSRGDIVQPKFIGSLRKRVDELLDCDPGLKDDLYNYLNYGRWPTGGSQGEKGSLLLSWYLQWFGVPAPFVMKAAVEKIKPKPKLMSSSLIPFLRLLFPSTHINAIGEMDKFLTS